MSELAGKFFNATWETVISASANNQKHPFNIQG